MVTTTSTSSAATTHSSGEPDRQKSPLFERTDMTEEHAEEADEGRVTAPQQEFGMSEVITGLAVLVVGLIITMGLPLALA